MEYFYLHVRDQVRFGHGVQDFLSSLSCCKSGGGLCRGTSIRTLHMVSPCPTYVEDETVCFNFCGFHLPLVLSLLCTVATLKLKLEVPDGSRCSKVITHLSQMTSEPCTGTHLGQRRKPAFGISSKTLFRTAFPEDFA